MRQSLLVAILTGIGLLPAQSPLQRIAVGGVDAPQIGGVYPHLASFNRQNECGIGAVVPWAGKLWWITYAPHKPRGSDDQLHCLDTALNHEVWPESVGGTPAGRMIHRETRQLLIGPYLIDAQGEIRVIPPQRMVGRLTGIARHLQDPTRKAYYATMEEGFYEVDLKTLAVRELFPDGNTPGNFGSKLLPGYHGKGLYSGHGRLIYANNGETGALAQRRPDIPSGALASWDGQGAWRVLRRNQFTEVTGPGGIYGNPRPELDPVWTIGWDHRSLILMVRDAEGWQSFRLPKASHCYDGAHGWNTEWPRIRSIGDNDLLMTMHGTFWRFPIGFARGRARGIRPRSTYLHVIGDFCRYENRIVFGCDDTARAQFLNKHRGTGPTPKPAQSHSNLWFVPPAQLDRLGPVLGRGGVWLEDPLRAGEASAAYLVEGVTQVGLHLCHQPGTPARFELQADDQGTGRWRRVAMLQVAKTGYRWFRLDQLPGYGEPSWLRLIPVQDGRGSAWFTTKAADSRGTQPAEIFAGLGRADATTIQGGHLRSLTQTQGLHLHSHRIKAGRRQAGELYRLRPDLRLTKSEAADPAAAVARIPAPQPGVLRIAGQSVLYVDTAGQRFRFPLGNPIYTDRPGLLDLQRTAREVVTERNLMQVAGTIYELPADNAGGLGRIRPIATHPYLIEDFCSFRGLTLLTGVEPDAKGPRIRRSSAGNAAVWLGQIDELWQLGKPRGRGGPWTRERVRRGKASDPYLMCGFDHKTLELSHDATTPLGFRIEVDIHGAGGWQPYQRLSVPPDRGLQMTFPDGFEACWIRLVPEADCVATALLVYK